MYFGSTIMTFALPYGAFIAATIALYYLFKARHSGPRLRWSIGSAAQVTSVTTREPGPAPAPEVTTGLSALPVPTEHLPMAPASEAPASEAPAAGEIGTTDDDKKVDEDKKIDDEAERKDGEPG
jgi:hypothetical protein